MWMASGVFKVCWALRSMTFSRTAIVIGSTTRFAEGVKKRSGNLAQGLKSLLLRGPSKSFNQ